uniref:Serine/threonine-protein kinase At1g54610 family n=1 Tax=Cajanus cajan TaxID=3821 RepID=A0A151S8X9_CAJCA|nr:putative serine/threonine-protein kinase At1g54610 family [Cajanus cajan]
MSIEEILTSVCEPQQEFHSFVTGSIQEKLVRGGFFTIEPYACDPSSLPKYSPSKEVDAKRRDDAMRRPLRGQVSLELNRSRNYGILAAVRKQMLKSLQSTSRDLNLMSFTPVLSDSVTAAKAEELERKRARRDRKEKGWSQKDINDRKDKGVKHYLIKTLATCALRGYSKDVVLVCVQDARTRKL